MATMSRISTRPRVSGKFLYVGGQKFWIKGVTYGPFATDNEGNEYGARTRVEADFELMVANGVNTLRTYTVPPRWLLDIAAEKGLRVMVGVAWEQHVCFLDNPATVRDIERRIQRAVEACAKHPAVLCYAIGNEIPASIVRWHGRRPIERFLLRLYRAAKRIDPTALVTYVNYPTTEYLELPFLDIVCFNVYLESQRSLDAYLARLQNLSNDRPLLMAEVGLDSLRNGEDAQAQTLGWQTRTVFEAGACGIFVFSWTDEWSRGGYGIEDWCFGLTTRERNPKPALDVVRRAFAAAPIEARTNWPKISVVVCTLNGGSTIRDTLEGLKKLDYPSYEVIVVNDGSTDRTAEIVAEYSVQLISTENRGLSSARNTGCDAATGEIVAYIDDDAWPDPDWLTYVALTFEKYDFVGVGGPNLPPPDDGPIADCVANAPGGPVHVLLSDRVAEHIPGCNMAFRRSALQNVGGFDPIYRAAGDDVDLCWRLQEAGGVIGFCPTAVVWHHRRNSLSMYWKQQRGYGKAEALLESKWPAKYNAVGHLSWQGRLYGTGLTQSVASLRRRLYGGVWGSAPFQSLYERSPGVALTLPLTPEWYLLVAGLALLALLGLAWEPLRLATPALILAIAFPVAQALLSARRARFARPASGLWQQITRHAMTAWLHLIQPVARLRGRIEHGLTPWRRRGPTTCILPFPRTVSVWRESPVASERILSSLQDGLSECGAVVHRGGEYDRWDLAIRTSLLGGARLRLAIEEHGAGKQMLRLRVWPYASRSILTGMTLCGLLAALAFVDAVPWVGALLGVAALYVAFTVLWHCGCGVGTTVPLVGKFLASTKS